MYSVLGSHGQGKVRENGKIQGQGKVREFWVKSGKFEILAKVREKSGNFRIRSRDLKRNHHNRIFD